MTNVCHPRQSVSHPGVPIEVVWDNLQAHKGPLVKEVARRNPRMMLNYLPPYAPDLNPAEGVWCLTKHHRMANHTISELDTLHAEARRHLEAVGGQPHLLRSCFEGAGLALSQFSAQ